MAESSLTQIIRQAAVTIVEFGPPCELVDERILEPLNAELLGIARKVDPPLLVIDLTQTRFFGSGFIEVLLKVWKELQTKAGSRMALCGVQTYCREVLEITHLDQLWPIEATREKAVARLQTDK